MLSSSNVERFEQIKSLEKEILELKENSNTKQNTRSLINNSTLKHKCEFCDNAFISKTVLKNHIIEDHEVKLLQDINVHKSRLLLSVQRLQRKDLSKLTVHKCKGLCRINHNRSLSGFVLS